MTLSGAALWAAALIVISIVVAIDPLSRTLLPLYHASAARWWAGADIYVRGPYGLNYLPHFAILFSPFHWLGVPAGDIAWRLVSGAWLVWGLRRLLAAAGLGSHFLWASVVALPMCLGAMRNGQANLAFAAATVEAAIWLIRGRAWPAAAFLAAAVAIKPIGLATLLLAPAVYRRLGLPLAVSLVVLAAFPLLLAPPGYVIAQYQDFWHNIAACSAIAEHRFANLFGIMRALGFEPAGEVSTAVSLCGALLSLGLWLALGFRSAEPQRGLFLLAIATGYLMLFNPMNESNGFVIVAPAMAAMCLRWLDQPGRRNQGRALGAIMLSIGYGPTIAAGADIGREFGLWWKPLVTLAFLGMVAAEALPRRAGALAAEAAPL